MKFSRYQLNHETIKMNIREKEDLLFAQWRTRYPDDFVIDGAPYPEIFEQSLARCLIILKDVNIDPDDPKADFPLRKQLAEKPHDWWRTIANWCEGISRIHGNETEQPSWSELDKFPLADCLKPFAFMQLKKSTGRGSVHVGTLNEHAKKDRVEIREQINIYQPKMIVCCGVGNLVVEVLEDNSKNLEWKETRRGVRYVKLQLNSQQTFLIDYMHPSARAAKNIVCFGLLDAYREIVNLKAS